MEHLTKIGVFPQIVHLKPLAKSSPILGKSIGANLSEKDAAMGQDFQPV